MSIANASFKKVMPCGKLHVEGKIFWLLNPDPLPAAEWQGKNVIRWLCVPFEQVGTNSHLDEVEVFIYSYARHVVSSAFTVEYLYNTDFYIWYWDLGDVARG